jgi:hypothetical protein
MSVFYDPIFGGGFGNGFGFGPAVPGMIANVSDAPADDGAVKASEPLKRNNFSVYGGGCGVPSRVPRPPLTYNTMRMMSMHSMLAFIFANIVKPITAAPYTVEVNPALIESGTVGGEELDKRKKMIEAAFKPHVKGAIRAACRAIQFGHWDQEVVYDAKDGFLAPARFKSFLPWEVQLQQDPYRDFAGLKYGSEFRDARYVYHHVNDPELDPIFGYSRHANVLPEWWDKLQHALMISSLGDKATKIVPIVKGPTGKQANADGTTSSGLEVAKKIAAALANREAVFMPQYIFDDSDIDPNKPEMAKFTAFDIDTVELDDSGPAMEALLSMITYDDVSMSRGWHQPERASMEGSHGTKAEAGVHKVGGIEDAESVCGDAYDSLNRGPLDQTLVANFGPGAEGSVYLKPAQLQDADKAFKQDFIKTLATTQETAPLVLDQVELRDNLEGAELTLKSEEDAAKATADREAKKAAADKAKADALKQQQQQPPANGGVPVKIAASANGNGHRSAVDVFHDVLRLGGDG